MKFGGRVFKIIIISGIAMLIAWVAESSVDEFEFLNVNANRIENISFSVVVSTSNVGARGKLISTDSATEKQVIVRNSRAFYREYGNGSDKFDEKARKLTRVHSGVSRIEDWNQSISGVVPSYVKYFIYPVDSFKNAAIVESNGAILRCRPRTMNAGGIVWEIKVNHGRGVVEGITTFDGKGQKVEKLQYGGWKRIGDVWLPGWVKVSNYSSRNIVRAEIVFGSYSVNTPEVERGMGQ